MKKIKQETPRRKATFVGDELVVEGKICFDYDIPKKWLPAVNTSVECPLAIVQLNIKNHCQVKENPLMFWSNVKLRTA